MLVMEGLTLIADFNDILLCKRLELLEPTGLAENAGEKFGLFSSRDCCELSEQAGKAVESFEGKGVLSVVSAVALLKSEVIGLLVLLSEAVNPLRTEFFNIEILKISIFGLE